MKYEDYDNLPMGSHYDYLDDHLEAFWLKVFGKTPTEMFCGGIVSAHGDKGYSYRRDFEKHGINFGRGMMLFLLSYSKLDRDELIKSLEWIIDNYEYYLPMLEAAEKEVTEDRAKRYQQALESVKRIYGENYETKEF